MTKVPRQSSLDFPLLNLLGLMAAVPALAVLVLLPWLQPGQGAEIPKFFIFLGRFHPLILHLPIGWILLAVLLEAQRLPLLRNWLPEVNPSLKTLIILLGAASAFVAVLLGWMLSYSGGYDPDLLQRHFTAGLFTAIGANLALISRLLPYRRAETVAYPILLVMTAGALTLAGHLGASITHGSDYLTEYAPDPVRKLLGLPVKVVHVIPAEVDDREAFADIIEPTVVTTCLSCHGPEKSKGGLRLDTYDLVMKGGQDGPVVVAGSPETSEILRRVNLPASDEKHMPPSGRPPLTDQQIALLTWWIKAGAPEKKIVAELKPPPDILQIISATNPTAAPVAPPTAPSEEASSTTEKVIPVTTGPAPPLPDGIPGRLEAIVKGAPDLEYSAGFHFAEVDDAQFNKLAPVASHLVWLDLARTHVTNGGLKLLPKMPDLEKLELQETQIGDSALASIAPLASLQVLNLNGTKITDQGLSQLAPLKKLQRVYLFDTAVTDAGEKNLKTLLPQVEIIRRLPTPIAPAPAAPTHAVAATRPRAVPPPGNETIWVDDALPSDATPKGDNAAWTFVTTDPAPFSGSRAWKISAAAGSHQVYFDDAPSLGATRKVLYVYAYLDPAHPPLEVMLQWHDSDGSWTHRAYWGKDNLLSPYGDAIKAGELPPTGQWVRLEVPSAAVGLDGLALTGLACSLYDGAAAFDKAGTSETSVPAARTGSETVWIDDALPADATPIVNNDAWNFVTADPAPYAGAKCWKTSVVQGPHQVYFENAPSLGATRNSLFCYVYLDPAHPPREVMLQWRDSSGSWNHRAWWGGGDNPLNGYGPAIQAGALPPTGQWIRLEVASRQVGLDGAALSGLAFSLYDGAAAFDKAGTSDSGAPVGSAAQASPPLPAK